MNKQFLKLLCERLKKRYEDDFNTLRTMPVVDADLTKSESDFLIELHRDLKEKLNRADLDHVDMLVNELDNIVDEKNTLLSSYKKKAEIIRAETDGRINHERTRAKVLAEKLNIIESKLNMLGVSVCIENDKIIFKDNNESNKKL